MDGNRTLDKEEYFFHTESALLLGVNVERQTGSSHVSVIGPNNDFVATTMSVALKLLLFNLVVYDKMRQAILTCAQMPA